MPFSVQHQTEGNSMDDEYSSTLTVIDVFDIASEIGKEFEKIIDQYGPDAVTSIMPKVIVALEHLECLASKNERENTKLQELGDHISKLEHEKLERVQDRLRFEKEVEEIEESWKEETQQLVEMVNRLQEENKKLSKRLEHEGSSPMKSQQLSPEIDISVLQKLRGQVDSLRDQMRLKEKELGYRNSDVDNLKRQIDRLTSTVRELRRKQRLSQVQVRGLIDERADFLAALQDHQREVAALKQQLGLAEKENEDLYNSQSDIPDLSNKAVYDLDDPNRPRFTTAELKEILHDRNTLKTRLNELEEELENVRRPARKRSAESGTEAGERTCDEEDGEGNDDSSPARRVSCQARSLGSLFSGWRCTFPDSPPARLPKGPRLEETTSEEERPVQGPLPYEPDDAPWKKSESGIRKFFRKLFSETSSVSFLPTASGSRSSAVPRTAPPLGSLSSTGAPSK
ncbi:hypothetical protein M8J77_022110 [Diaphorina citri]|nr:hypothetical protein M8J77_022110 [Diaphorina citri]